MRRALLLVLMAAASARADDTLLPHPDGTRWWLSGQLNLISQWHGRFPERYHGVNSLSADAEGATSLVGTIYTGLRLTPTTEVLLDFESAGGGGLSEALGLAGFTNLDVVRNPTLGSAPYVARAIVHQIIPLAKEMTDAPRGPFEVFARVPVRRIEIHAGKISTADYFDVNSIGSDSHLQFMNWTADNNGAYDYAADTRGYTLGAVVEYDDRAWSVRLGEMLMPTVANGIDYDFDLAHARGENLELELRHPTGTVRLLGFLNHANMGLYREAIDDAMGTTPDVTAHRAKGRLKPGVGLNVEQTIRGDLRMFGRAGWSDGRVESFAYTEVDDTVAVGVEDHGSGWFRPRDKVGLAFISNGLAADHRAYLALGGHGFLLGDGGLTYGRETIVEGYYTAHLGRGISPAVDVQFVANPGYNRDRGPLTVVSARLHIDL